VINLKLFAAEGGRYHPGSVLEEEVALHFEAHSEGAFPQGSLECLLRRFYSLAARILKLEDL